MERIVECVPNFSEGRDRGIIDAIAAAISSTPGVMLLDVDPNPDYNRVVVTFVGSPEMVGEVAFCATAVAAERIDMTRHKGEHPRIGAADVVPFVPVRGVTMTDCVEIAKRYGKRVAEELHIPVYLYEEAATRPERRNLATVRKGEYEGLREKLRDPDWAPDFGAALFNPRSGATVTGAREFLIAYNVNLDTDDAKVAHEISLRIRESGRPMRDGSAKIVVDARGEKVMIPGRLKAIKAMGVPLEAHAISQVSVNVVNYHITPPHVVFEEVKNEAATLGCKVTGSEIVGLIPLEAVLIAGRFYAKNNPGLTEGELVQCAIENLNLSQLGRFDPKKKIIEYLLESEGE